MKLLRSPALKVAFLVVAGLAAALAVVANWSDIQRSADRLGVTDLIMSGIASVLYVVFTMLSWRSVMADLGSPLTLRAASQLFFISQLGKYIPGGVWNVVAVGEMGTEHGVPRRSSLSGMLVFWLVSVVTGMLTGTAYVLGRGGNLGEARWLAILLPAALILVAPPVLRRLLRAILRLARREPLLREPTGAGLAKATAWAMVGWIFAGAQVWQLSRALSDLGEPSFFAAVGGYALAWTAGFLVVFAPAGAGIREVVLGGLMSDSMTVGAVVALVLLSRLFITGADFTLAAAAAISGRRSRA